MPLHGLTYYPGQMKLAQKTVSNLVLAPKWPIANFISHLKGRNAGFV
jgi:hypothetical protein